MSEYDLDRPTAGKWMKHCPKHGLHLGRFRRGINMLAQEHGFVMASEICPHCQREASEWWKAQHV